MAKVKNRIRSVALIAIGIAVCSILMALPDVRPSSADVPWPTPPPGPRPPVPRVETDIKPVNVPLVTGATSWVVHPLAALVPRFPPVPSSAFQSSDGVRIVSDAGSIDSTIQLVYKPVVVADAIAPGPGQQLRKVFDLIVFDHQANQITINLRRPWVLEVPIRGLIQSFEDPARLLIARYDEKRGWIPLVTSYYRDRGTLQTRVLRVGLFGVIAEPSVISG